MKNHPSINRVSRALVCFALFLCIIGCTTITNIKTSTADTPYNTNKLNSIINDLAGSWCCVNVTNTGSKYIQYDNMLSFVVFPYADHDGPYSDVLGAMVLAEFRFAYTDGRVVNISDQLPIYINEKNITAGFGNSTQYSYSYHVRNGTGELLMKVTTDDGAYVMRFKKLSDDPGMPTVYKDRLESWYILDSEHIIKHKSSHRLFKFINSP